LIVSIPPVATEYLYRAVAATTTIRIGQRAKMRPSSAAAATGRGANRMTDRAMAAAMISPPGPAIWPGCPSMQRDKNSQAIGVIAARKSKKSIMIIQDTRFQKKNKEGEKNDLLVRAGYKW
jgi:hypothetical protein